MTTEELRRKLTGRIEALLARTVLVRGEDRALLAALGAYVAVMAGSELEKVLGFFAHGERDMPKGSKVDKVYQALKEKGYGKAKSARIAQAKTGRSLKTGKKPKKK